MVKKNNLISNYFFNYFRLLFYVAAICIAYTCNERSEKNNKYLMAFVAILFPEIYLAQALVRYSILKDYKC